MKFADLQNRGEAELKELLGEQRAELHALPGKARSRELWGEQQMKTLRQMIARILTILTARDRASAAPAKAG